MELRVLRYFLTVAREGNITRAAELLHMTQPTLSRQLMQLEEELGTVLFMRGKRKIVLTEAGMILKRRAEEILSLSHKAEMEISSQNHEINGEVSIGCGMMQATQTMGKFIQKFHHLYPSTSFHFRSGNSDFVVENIDNGLLDLGIVLEPVDLEKLHFLRLKEKERWGILMRKDSLLAQKAFVTAEDLKNLPLINTARQQTQNYFSRWYGEDYEQLHFSGTSELASTAAILVKNHIGYAILIEGALSQNMTDDLCFRPLFPELYSHALIVWKKYQTLNLTVSQFVDFLSNEVKERRSEHV